MDADLLITNIGQLVTCASPEGPKRGAAMRDPGIIPDGAVAVKEGRLIAVGPADALAGVRAARVVDARGTAVCPGFVDAHTHVVYAGDRVHEFELRIQGASYMEIMAAGGGIVSTMRQTRAAAPADLVAAALPRLDEMLALGTTTVEIKSGYGLEPQAELAMLRAIAELERRHPCTLVPTFLGAHTVPPEFRDDAAGYVAQVIDEMLPAVSAWYAASPFAAAGVPLFVDVFCEDHAFTVAQAERILRAGQAAGFGAKIHVDQFTSLGGAAMAAAIGAVSADHLDVTRPADVARLAASGTVCVPLPAVNFNLGQTAFAPARALVDAGAAVALATDANPGSAPCLSMPLVMAIACRYQRLLPAEALLAATINAAHALRLADRVGSLEVGKQADLLLLKQADYRHLAYFFGGNPVARILKRGVWVDEMRA